MEHLAQALRTNAEVCNHPTAHMPQPLAVHVQRSIRGAVQVQRVGAPGEPAIYEALTRWNQYKNLKEIIVTENGAAFEDIVENSAINDSQRLNYIKDHIGQVKLAIQNGVRVKGYFVWTFLDNFEWAEGYYPKFGLIHVNFKTQERIIKSSGKWYADFLRPDDNDDLT